MPTRVSFNVDEYRRSVKAECFICNIVSHGNLMSEHAILFEDDNVIAFLNKYPTQIGQSIVAPKPHLQHVFSDLDDAADQHLMSMARKVGRAIQETTNAERMYFLSLGSNQLNDHIHLHLFPLPNNTPLDQQQLNALDNEMQGYLLFTKSEADSLAAQIRTKM